MISGIKFFLALLTCVIHLDCTGEAVRQVGGRAYCIFGEFMVMCDVTYWEVATTVT